MDIDLQKIKQKYPEFLGKNGGRFIDETGNRYGSLTVLYQSANKSDNKIKWVCLCDCGNIIETLGRSLRTGSTKSCGCSKIKRLSELNAVNLIGKKYGYLTVVKKTEKRKNGKVVWECACDCGNIVEATTGALQTGHVKSCGCKSKYLNAIAHQKLIPIGTKFEKLTVISDPIWTEDGFNYKCKCECGNETIVNGIYLRSGNTKSCGCMVSYGETLVKKVLNDLNIEYKTQYSFDDLINPLTNHKLRFDFAVFNNNKLNFLIEFDGEQHFDNKFYEPLENIQARDEIKNQYCINNKIKLLRIDYNYRDYDSIYNIINNYIKGVNNEIIKRS